MKTKLKGMTLVELLVAITILFYASLMLVVAFANIAMINRENHNFNERMSKQIKTAENESLSSGDMTKTPNNVTISVTSDGGFTAKTYYLAGDSCWIDNVDGATNADGSSRDPIEADFKYYVSVLPPRRPDPGPAPEPDPGT